MNATTTTSRKHMSYLQDVLDYEHVGHGEQFGKYYVEFNNSRAGSRASEYHEFTTRAAMLTYITKLYNRAQRIYGK